MTPATSSPFPHTFLPWVSDGPRRVVASETEWSRLRDMDRAAAASGERPIVLIGVDVFEPWEREYVDEDGQRMHDEGGGWWCRAYETADDEPLPLRHPAVVSRLFGFIDDCPHLRFVLPTRHPGRVAEVMPKCDCGAGTALGPMTGHWKQCPAQPRPNLSLLLDVGSSRCDYVSPHHGDRCDWGRVQSPNAQFTQDCPRCKGTGYRSPQAEVDAGFEDVAWVPAAVHGLRLTVTKEMEGIDLRELMWPCCQRGESEGRSPCPLCLERGREFPPGDLDWLILRGEVGPDARSCPLHVMRRLIGEARAAGVPVWVEGLGKTVLGTLEDLECVGGEDSNHMDDGTGRYWVRLHDHHITNPAEWPEWARVRELPQGEGRG